VIENSLFFPNIEDTLAMIYFFLKRPLKRPHDGSNPNPNPLNPNPEEHAVLKKSMKKYISKMPDNICFWLIEDAAERGEIHMLIGLPRYYSDYIENLIKDRLRQVMAVVKPSLGPLYITLDDDDDTVDKDNTTALIDECYIVANGSHWCVDDPIRTSFYRDVFTELCKLLPYELVIPWPCVEDKLMIPRLVEMGVSRYHMEYLYECCKRRLDHHTGSIKDYDNEVEYQRGVGVAVAGIPLPRELISIVRIYVCFH